ncbi:hypothetical protein [Virgibacillus sp. MSP4-1]|nr:hypothetical protein [Virgibacillus sp. MSP4-1]
MWSVIVERLPDGLSISGIILSYVIPFLTFKINEKLHEAGDPPWKKEV